MDNPEVRILKEAKRRLTDYDSWCPVGADRQIDGKTQQCFVYTLVAARGQGVYGGTNEHNLVSAAAHEILGGGVDLADYNDGDGKWQGIPDRTRWETLHKILGRAIELAEVEGLKS